MNDQDPEVSDYEWAWSVLCEEFRSLPADAAQPEAAPTAPPVDHPPTDGENDV